MLSTKRKRELVFLNPSEVYPGDLKTSKVDSFARIAYNEKLLTIFAKLFVLDICDSLGYAPCTA